MPDPRYNPQPGDLPADHPDVVAGRHTAPPPGPPTELLASMPTDELRRTRSALRSHIPGDPTWSAAVSRVLGHLLDLNLTHPDRARRDEEAAQAQAEQRAAADAEALAAKHESERAALPEDHPDRAALDQKHELEQREAARAARLKEIDAQQAEEREEFAAKQAADRNAALAASAEQAHTQYANLPPPLASGGRGAWQPPPAGPQFDQRPSAR